MKTFLLVYRIWNGKLGVEEFKTSIFESSDYDSAWKEAYDTFDHCVVELKQLN